MPTRCIFVPQVTLLFLSLLYSCALQLHFIHPLPSPWLHPSVILPTIPGLLYIMNGGNIYLRSSFIVIFALFSRWCGCCHKSMSLSSSKTCCWQGVQQGSREGMLEDSVLYVGSRRNAGMHCCHPTQDSIHTVWTQHSMVEPAYLPNGERPGFPHTLQHVCSHYYRKFNLHVRHTAILNFQRFCLTLATPLVNIYRAPLNLYMDGMVR